MLAESRKQKAESRKQKAGKSFVFAFLMISIASAVHAEEATDKLKKMLDLGSGEIELSCFTDSEVKDVFGITGFVRKKCPYVTPKKLDIIQTKGEGTASKGNITYSFDCVLRIREYNYGVMTKTWDEHPHGAVSAEYMLAFGDIAIRNTRSTGSELCAAPIANKINSVNRQ